MRKKIDYIVNDVNNPENRDNNKHFIIEEMPAFQAEKWCYKAIGAMIRSGVYFPENINPLELPAQILALFGITHFLKIDFEYLNPLLEEMINCIKFRANENNPALDRPISKETSDICEISTLINLRMEVFKLHMGFLKGVIAPLMNQYFGNQEVQ